MNTKPVFKKKQKGGSKARQLHGPLDPVSYEQISQFLDTKVLYNQQNLEDAKIRSKFLSQEELPLFLNHIFLWLCTNHNIVNDTLYTYPGQEFKYTFAVHVLYLYYKNYNLQREFTSQTQFMEVIVFTGLPIIRIEIFIDMKKFIEEIFIKNKLTPKSIGPACSDFIYKQAIDFRLPTTYAIHLRGKGVVIADQDMHLIMVVLQHCPLLAKHKPHISKILRDDDENRKQKSSRN